MKQTLLILFSCLTLNLQAQTFFEKDSVFNVKRTAWTSGVIGAGWLGSVVSLKNIWYKENWTNKFHSFDDSKQWLGMDKVGHFYTGNMITKNISSVYDWSGMKRSQRLIIGSTVGFGYLTTLEILDGYSEEWGFSWADLGANALGVAWYVWQDLVWEEQRFKLKFSAHLTPYASYRPEVLGSSFPERLLKDYNGQTYWLSFTPSQFLNSSSSFPNWLSFSFGYSVDKKLHGDLNVYNHIDSKLGIETFNAERQFLFSLDIDFEQFSPEKKWISTLFKVINHIKIPFPALIFNGKQLIVHPLYF